MSRVTDLAVPAIAGVHPPSGPSATWAAQPIVGLEWLPQIADVWDDVDGIVWDDPALVWDEAATAIGLTDVWCDTVGLEIIHGEPDEQELIPPSRATLNLYDPTGKYRRRTADGRLVYFAAGRRLAVIARHASGDWWLFNGRVATWHELAGGYVEIVAYSSAATLAQDSGRSWTAGVAGDTIRPRATAILAAHAVAAGIVLRADVGDATLSVPAAEPVPPLEAVQRAAWSDGGVVFSDADDTLIVRDRRWRDGRSDQTSTTVFTDNVCDIGAVVVELAEIANDDEWLAGRVVLANVAGLVAQASNPAETIDPSLIYTHPDTDLWRTQGEGDALAAHIANMRGAARLAVGLARVYLHDTRFDYWRRMIDLRLGDRVGWTSQLGDDLVDVDAIACTVRHLLTGETWIVEFETTPATGYRVVETWDQTSLEWDSADPLAVWR